MNNPDKPTPNRPSLAGLDLQRLMVEGLNPDTHSDSDSAPPGIEGFEILRPIGRGGMGQVFLARQQSLDRLVAVKRIGGGGAAATSFLDRLEREAKTMARVSHPNLVGVFDFIRLADGNAALVMEWVAGGTLRESLLAGTGKLKVEEALDLIEPVLSGLEAAHRAGIVHRDIKPENVLFSSDGTLKVTDFGLSLPDNEEERLTVTGTYVGTPGYMAPEQHEGGQADARTDIYAVGVMLYEMLTGKAPVGHFDPPSKRNPKIPKQISSAILACLRTDPADRPDSVATLRSLLSGTEKSGSRRAALLAGATGIVALGAGGWYFGKRAFDSMTENEGETGEPSVSGDPAGFTKLSGDWYENGDEIESNGEIAFCAVESKRDILNSRVRFSFTRLSGEHSVALFFRLPNGFGSFELSAWELQLGGVQTINGDDLRNLPSAFRMSVENNRRYEVELVVTQQEITSFVDGEKKQTQNLGTSDFGVARPWQIGVDFSQTKLALATYQSPTIWHGISVEEI